MSTEIDELEDANMDCPWDESIRLKLPILFACVDIQGLKWVYDGTSDSGSLNLDMIILADGSESCVDEWLKALELKYPEMHNFVGDMDNVIGELLESLYGGWEINEGSFGTLEIRRDGIVRWAHSARVEETVDSNHRFHWQPVKVEPQETESSCTPTNTP